MIAHVRPYEGMRMAFHLDVPYANGVVMNDLVILNTYYKRKLRVLSLQSGSTMEILNEKL